jgi:hypothetical protein
MDGDIIAFTLPKRDRKAVNQFCKKFYGQETSCQNGKYRYRRKGLLDHVPHRKLIRGVIIFPLEHVKEVVDFLEGFEAEYHIREVKLTSEDKEELGLKS